MRRTEHRVHGVVLCGLARRVRFSDGGKDRRAGTGISTRRLPATSGGILGTSILEVYLNCLAAVVEPTVTFADINRTRWVVGRGLRPQPCV